MAIGKISAKKPPAPVPHADNIHVRLLVFD